VRSPSKERSWLKADCGAELMGGGLAPPRASAAAPPPRDTCAACAAVASDVLRALGGRRRSEAEVVTALEGSCERLGDGEAGGAAWCWAVLETHAESLEASLVGRGPPPAGAEAQAELAQSACAAAVPECGS
jgi:hypothetical protein